MAYMRQAVIPNIHERDCLLEPGVKFLVGSAERIISKLVVQNLISVMNIDTLISKIRMNRVIDCLGIIEVFYEPGLLSSHALKK